MRTYPARTRTHHLKTICLYFVFNRKSSNNNIAHGCNSACFKTALRNTCLDDCYCFIKYCSENIYWHLPALAVEGAIAIAPDTFGSKFRTAQLLTSQRTANHKCTSSMQTVFGLLLSSKKYLFAFHTIAFSVTRGVIETFHFSNKKSKKKKR